MPRSRRRADCDGRRRSPPRGARVLRPLRVRRPLGELVRPRIGPPERRAARAADDGAVAVCGVALRARAARSVRHRRPRSPGSASAGEARVLARGLLPAAQGCERAVVCRRRAAVSVHAGRRGRGVRDSGRPGARRRHRARSFSVQRHGRDDHRHEVAPVLHAQGHREAVRGARSDGLRGARRARFRRHERRPRARLLSGDRGGGPGGSAAARAALARRVARARAPVQPYGRLRRHRERHRLRDRARALLPHPRASAAAEQAAHGLAAAARHSRTRRAGPRFRGAGRSRGRDRRRAGRLRRDRRHLPREHARRRSSGWHRRPQRGACARVRRRRLRRARLWRRHRRTARSSVRGL